MTDTAIWTTLQNNRVRAHELDARERTGMNLRSAQFHLLSVGEVELASQIDPIIDALENIVTDDVH